MFMTQRHVTLLPQPLQTAAGPLCPDASSSPAYFARRIRSLGICFSGGSSPGHRQALISGNISDISNSNSFGFSLSESKSEDVLLKLTLTWTSERRGRSGRERRERRQAHSALNQCFHQNKQTRAQTFFSLVWFQPTCCRSSSAVTHPCVPAPPAATGHTVSIKSLLAQLS